MCKIEKINCLKFFDLFFTSTSTTKKLDDGISVKHFSGLQVTVEL